MSGPRSHSIRPRAGAFPGGAQLYVLGPYTLFFGPAASAAGLGTVQILPFLPPAAAGAGRFEMQGALGILATGLPKLTNGQTIVP